MKVISLDSFRENKEKEKNKTPFDKLIDESYKYIDSIFYQARDKYCEKYGVLLDKDVLYHVCDKIWNELYDIVHDILDDEYEEEAQYIDSSKYVFGIIKERLSPYRDQALQLLEKERAPYRKIWGNTKSKS